MMEKGGKIGRYLFCIAFVAVLFIVYITRLVQWQIVEGEHYANISYNQGTSFIKMDAARGEILDRNGNILVGNQTTYSIMFNALTLDFRERNRTIIKVLALLEATGEEWIDRLPIQIDENGEYYFVEDAQGEIAYMKSSEILNMQDYATAEDCINEFIRKYDCEGYAIQDQRDLISVRYSMQKMQFGRTNPYEMARGVSVETIGIISERAEEFVGVEPAVKPMRFYNDGSLAPHVLGAVGAISAAQYERASEQGNTYSSENLSGYTINDVYGQSGIENAYESYLRGKAGKQIILSDNFGEIIETKVTLPPVPGGTIETTIDANLQRAANEALRENVLSSTAADCVAGAAVAIDVKTGGVLVSASYPTFDMGRYTMDDRYYNNLVQDSTKPLFNRALDGVFTPGSVFKPMVAAAAIEEGIVTQYSTPVMCEGIYTFYNPPDQPGCLGIHGFTDVFTALRDSCNVYFYDVGRMLGIKRMGAYADYFSLGKRTGIEISESSGKMTNPEDYEYNHGVPWTDGLTMHAAIGQSDNMFTPIQLASYCAAIANNGTRYKTHLMSKIYNYQRTEIIEEYQPEILAEGGVSYNTMVAVQEGMRLVTSSGTAKHVFGDYAITVAGKTGTAENTRGHSANLTFIAYAPYYEPEIAVGVVIEYGGRGDYAMNVAKAIFDEYFFPPERDEYGNIIETQESEYLGNQDDTADDELSDGQDSDRAQEHNSRDREIPEAPLP